VSAYAARLRLTLAPDTVPAAADNGGELEAAIEVLGLIALKGKGDSYPGKHDGIIDRAVWDRPDGPCHPCRDPPIANAAVLRVRLKLPASERTRLGRSVWRAEKRDRCAGVMRVGGTIRPHSGVLAHSSAALGTKHLIRWQSQATLIPDHGPLGECRL
jgi:hypothetical protein